MDVKELLDHVNLVTLFERELGQPVRAGRWLTYRCPCHEDHHPSLAITPDRKRWVCFGRCNTKGDAIDWLCQRHRMDFGAACRELQTIAGVAPTATPAHKQELLPTGEDMPPNWQADAHRVVTECQECLFSAGSGQLAREALHSRSLTDATLIYWRIGYNPTARVIAGLWVPRGVVIPWIDQHNIIWALKVRLTNPRHQMKTDAPKYAQVAGARPALFGGYALENHANAVALVTEGEFDAMLVHQQAHDLVSAVTAGSAGAHLGWRWLSLFRDTKIILAAHDVDPAGEKAATWWSALSSRVRRVQLPFGNDVTEFAQQGGDVRAWVQFYLVANNRES
jgi:DNA primase